MIIGVTNTFSNILVISHWAMVAGTAGNNTCSAAESTHVKHRRLCRYVLMTGVGIRRASAEFAFDGVGSCSHVAGSIVAECGSGVVECDVVD